MTVRKEYSGWSGTSDRETSKASAVHQFNEKLSQPQVVLLAYSKLLLDFFFFFFYPSPLFYHLWSQRLTRNSAQKWSRAMVNRLNTQEYYKVPLRMTRVEL